MRTPSSGPTLGVGAAFACAVLAFGAFFDRASGAMVSEVLAVLTGVVRSFMYCSFLRNSCF
jgi:hypothetical protein